MISDLNKKPLNDMNNTRRNGGPPLLTRPVSMPHRKVSGKMMGRRILYSRL